MFTTQRKVLLANTQKNVLTAIWGAAIALNVLLLFLYYHGPAPRGLMGDEAGYVLQAQGIASGALVGRGPPWPPGYGMVLAAFFFVSNALHLAPYPFHYLLVQLFQMGLWAASGVLFMSIIKDTVSSSFARLVAVGLFLLFPTVIAFSHYFWPEIPHLAAYLAALWIIIKKPPTARWSILLGISLATATLLKLVYLPIAPILCCVPVARAFRIGHRQLLLSAILAPLLFFSLLAPVCYLNYLEHDKFMVADSSAFNAWVGLNDKELTDWHPNAICGDEMEEYMASAPSHNARNEIYVARIRDFIADQGIAATLLSQVGKHYYRLLDHRTFFTKQLPGGMAPKYPIKSPLVAGGLRVFNDLIWAALLFGLGVGIVVTASQVRSLSALTWIHMFVGFVAYNALLFSILHVKTRYVVAFFPMLCTLSAVGWDAFTCHAGWRRDVPRKKLPLGILTLGVVVSLLLLHLAFRDILVRQVW